MTVDNVATTAHWDALAIHPDDNVAVALRDLVAGESIRVRRRGAIETALAREPIPLGHKLALAPLAAGAAIRKYGECIGVATAEIATGAHVHVHNMTSVRAKVPKP
jgi:altronate dehydratase